MAKPNGYSVELHTRKLLIWKQIIVWFDTLYGLFILLVQLIRPGPTAEL